MRLQMRDEIVRQIDEQLAKLKAIQAQWPRCHARLGAPASSPAGAPASRRRS